MRKKPSSLDLRSKIYVAGHKGMVGRAILSALQERGAKELIYKSKEELDLRDQSATKAFFKAEQPKYVFLAAAKVGGILSNNQFRADFLYDNLLITTNVIQSAYEYGTKKLLFLGSSCVYPKHASQPLREEQLLSSTLEPTNEPYAIAKIVGIKLCESYRDQHNCNFIAAVSTNLYGPGDNYDLQSAHVLPALLRKIHEAKEKQLDVVEIWGTGIPKRELMHVNDMVDACLLLMEKYDANPQEYPSFVNVGVSEDISISSLAQLIKKMVGYKGELRFNPAKPDGVTRKLLDTNRLKKLGFRPKIKLIEGIKAVYTDYIAKQEKTVEVSPPPTHTNPKATLN